MSARTAINVALTTHCPSLDDYAKAVRVADAPEIDALSIRMEAAIEEVRPFSESLEVLERLRAQGFLMAIISNLATPYKKPFEVWDLASYFDEVFFSCDCGTIKPGPEIYQAALAALGTKPQETLMVGDSLRCDVWGPAALGIHALHLDRKTQEDAQKIASLRSVCVRLAKIRGSAGHSSRKVQAS